MKRLVTLCHFFTRISAGLAAWCFMLAVAMHDINFLFLSIVSAIFCIITVYNVIKAQMEEENKANSKKKKK